MSKRLLDKLPELMKDPGFAAAWEEAREEFAVARETVRDRTAAGRQIRKPEEKLKSAWSGK